MIAYLTDDHGWAHKAGEGGAWLDMGVHLFDALRWFTGSEVEVIFAKVRDFAGDPNQRRSGLAEVVMRNGVIVQVLISFEVPTPASARRASGRSSARTGSSSPIRTGRSDSGAATAGKTSTRCRRSPSTPTSTARSA